MSIRGVMFAPRLRRDTRGRYDLKIVRHVSVMYPAPFVFLLEIPFASLSKESRVTSPLRGIETRAIAFVSAISLIAVRLIVTDDFIPSAGRSFISGFGE